MTSFLTTGGIRGGSEKVGRFQPRSFNMGMSRQAFEHSHGFGDIHPGEDPDLAIRLWKMDYRSKLFPNAYVYHKRRIDWQKFSIQVNKFGKARPILDLWHPQYKKWSFLFPTLFIAGLTCSLLLGIAGYYGPLACFGIYFAAIFAVSSLKNKSIAIGMLSIIAAWKQFYGYGTGYLESYFKVRILKKDPRAVFPELFFGGKKILRANLLSSETDNLPKQ